VSDRGKRLGPDTRHVQEIQVNAANELDVLHAYPGTI
jgi:hypothetical protein